MASAVSPLIRGTSLSVRKERVVDGDTIRVFLPGRAAAESIRILNVDTEESFSFSSTKPVTPLGKVAKSFAADFFRGETSVTLELPDNTLSLDEALTRYRGAFGRVLAYVWRERDGADFGEALIRAGLSPYSMKYGHAAFDAHRFRYVAAERTAQKVAAGVWDDANNGGVQYNNYAAFRAWWELRATGVQAFRKFRARMGDQSLLHSAEDYAEIQRLANIASAQPVAAAEGDTNNATDSAAKEDIVVTVFADIRNLRVVSGQYAVSDLGSDGRPLRLFIPRVSQEAANQDGEGENGEDKMKEDKVKLTNGEQVVNLLNTRYVDAGPVSPRRGYVFLSGRLGLFRGRPQLTVTHPSMVGDEPGTRAVPVPSSLSPAAAAGDEENDEVPDAPDVAAPLVDVRIVALLPDPAGVDRNHEVVTLAGMGEDPTALISLDDWSLKDIRGHSFKFPKGLKVSAAGKAEAIQVTLKHTALMLNNSGDEVFLLDPRGQIVHHVSYTKAEVVTGTPVEFPLE